MAGEPECGVSSLLHQGVGEWGGEHKSRRMSNGADRRGGEVNTPGCCFYRTFHLGGTISPTPSLKCVMVLSIPPAAEAKSL